MFQSPFFKNSLAPDITKFYIVLYHHDVYYDIINYSYSLILCITKNINGLMGEVLTVSIRAACNSFTTRRKKFDGLHIIHMSN